MSNLAYLTCELKARDLDSRLLLAGHLLGKGFQVIVGQQWAMFLNAPNAPVGTYLFKSANQIQAREMIRCKGAGHAVITADEEMLAAVDRPEILRLTHIDAIKNSDLFLFQNDLHEKVLRDAHPGIRGQATGNARIDLLSRFRALYDQDTAALTKAGRYILVNTNFPMISSIWGSQETALTAVREGGALNTSEDKKAMSARLEDERICRDHILDLVQRMRKDVRDYRIVVRPHPAEDPAMWRAIEGVEVVEGSNPIPWINGAALVVHSNCTTGFETMLLGRPCINLNPLPAEATQYIVRVNYEVASSDAALQDIKTFLTTGQGPIADFTPPLTSYPAGAAQRIADAMFDVAIKLPPTARKATWTPIARDEIQRKKFSVSKEEVQSKMALIAKALGLEGIAVSQMDDSLFSIKRAAPAARP